MYQTNRSMNIQGIRYVRIRDEAKEIVALEFHFFTNFPVIHQQIKNIKRKIKRKPVLAWFKKSIEC
jgi:hypothetical protein